MDKKKKTFHFVRTKYRLRQMTTYVNTPCATIAGAAAATAAAALTFSVYVFFLFFATKRVRAA